MITLMCLHYNLSWNVLSQFVCDIKEDSLAGGLDYWRPDLNQPLIKQLSLASQLILPLESSKYIPPSIIFSSDALIIVLFFQAFREEIAPINLKVKTVNDLSSQLSPLDLHPSLKMSRELDDLNMRWKLLQVLSAYSSSLFRLSPWWIFKLYLTILPHGIIFFYRCVW